MSNSLDIFLNDAKFKSLNVQLSWHYLRIEVVNLVILTVLVVCFVLVVECALRMRGDKHDEMSQFFLSRALVEVGFITIIISLFSVIFDVVGILSRPQGVQLENAQVASLIVNIKYLAIGIGTYLIFFIKYHYTLRHADKEGD